MQKNIKTDASSSQKARILLKFIFPLIIAIIGACVAVGLNQYFQSSEKQKDTLQALNTARIDVYKSRQLIEFTEEKVRSAGDVSNPVNIWSPLGIALPYPNAFELLTTDSSLLSRLSEPTSYSVYDYREKLDSDRNLIMSLDVSILNKSSIYLHYKRNLQDLVLILQNEIEFQEGELTENQLQEYLLKIRKDRVALEREDLQELENFELELERQLRNHNYLENLSLEAPLNISPK